MSTASCRTARQPRASFEVISAVQDYMQTVLNRADSIIDGVDGVNGLLDQTQTILDVDVNVTDISDELSVSPSYILQKLTGGQLCAYTAVATLPWIRIQDLGHPPFMQVCMAGNPGACASDLFAAWG